MKLGRKLKVWIDDHRVIPHPKDFVIAYAIQVPEVGKPFECYFFETGSNWTAHKYIRVAKRVHECEQIDKLFYRVNLGDAYYYVAVVRPPFLHRVHLGVAKMLPVVGERYVCSKIVFDRGTSYSIYWTTDFVKSYRLMKSKYGDNILEMKTVNGSLYYIMIF